MTCLWCGGSGKLTKNECMNGFHTGSAQIIVSYEAVCPMCGGNSDKKCELRGYFEYSDPYEPVGFIFDKETKKKLDGVWCLSELIEKIDKDVKDRRTYEYGKEERNTNGVKWFKITIEEV